MPGQARIGFPGVEYGYENGSDRHTIRRTSITYPDTASGAVDLNFDYVWGPLAGNTDDVIYRKKGSVDRLLRNRTLRNTPCAF